MISTLPNRPLAHRGGDPASRLRSTMAAVRVSLSGLGTHKTLTPEQKSTAADPFDASGQFLAASKKLLDNKHPAFRAVTGVRGRIIQFWKGMTLPYAEPGVRLIRLDQIDLFNSRMNELREELDEAVEQLDRHYGELQSMAQSRLGRLFNPQDYPPSLRNLFTVDWDYPSVEPPSYLQQVSPELYEQECRRVAARFDEALQLTEQAFCDELSQLIVHLNERLTGAVDGKPKVFRDSAVTNLVEFFARFRNLNVRSNEQLDELVSQTQQIVQGIEPQALRDNRVLRQTVAAELAELRTSLDTLLVDRPRRNIVRRTPAIPEVA